MTVVLDARHLWREISGIERYVLGLVEGLSSVESGLRVIVLGRSQGKAATAASAATYRAGLEYVPCDIPVRSPANHLRLPGLLKRLGCRVYHSPYVEAPLLGRGFATVITLHDMTPTTRRAENRRSLKTALPALWNAWLALQCGRAAAIVTVSEFSKGQILGLTRTRPGKVHAIHNGVTVGRTALSPEDVRRRFGLNGRLVSYVGRQDPHKNLQTLVRAFAKVVATGRTDATLVIAGRLDSRYPEAARTAAELGLGERVRFTGYIDEDERVALLRASSVFVFPSRSEGFGFPPLEAMAEGVPVVALRGTCFPEILADAAVLVDDELDRMSGAILSLLEDERLAATYRRRGRERAAGFTWQRSAAEHVRIYRSLLRDAGGLRLPAGLELGGAARSPAPEPAAVNLVATDRRPHSAREPDRRGQRPRSPGHPRLEPTIHPHPAAE